MKENINIRNFKLRTMVLHGVCLGLGCLMFVGCQKTDQAKATTPKKPQVEMPKTHWMTSPSCSENADKVEGEDVNRDGKTDLRHFFTDEKRYCSEFDLNFDGKTDLRRFYEPSGEVQSKEEYDLDFDGRMDQLNYYQKDKLFHRKLDTNFDNVVDTWIWCDGELLGRVIRDNIVDGRADVWEFYEGGQAKLIIYDRDLDANPDMWESFENGVLRTVEMDTDGDRLVDSKERVALEDQQSAGEPVLCTFNPVVVEEDSSNEDSRASPPTEGAAAIEQGVGGFGGSEDSVADGNMGVGGQETESENEVGQGENFDEGEESKEVDQ